MAENSTTSNGQYVGIGVVGIFIIGFLIYIASVDQAQTEKSKIESLAIKHKTDSIKKIERTNSKKQDSTDRAIRTRKYEADVKKFPLLKKKFKAKNDKFEDITWYTHENQVDVSRTTILVHVNNKGFIYLESQYHRPDWIFHKSFTVLIGDQKYNSTEVDGENNRTEVGDGVWENVNYTDRANYNIIQAISENVNKKIEVRLNGRQYYHDFTLTEKDKIAIKDAAEFSSMLSLGFE